MKKTHLAAALTRALATAALLSTALPVLAQDAVGAPAATGPAAAEPKDLDRIVVMPEIAYRNRTSDTAPVLSYDLEYFQRFEPNTVGDMVKRVPGAGFVGSDVMEFDGVQMRGLAGGYTQVLINGKKVPGAGDDRSFWVDRIPADMVDRIEILRSNSANRSGDAVAGAINIILRDAYEFDGSYIRVGLNRWFDGEVNPTFGAVTSAEALGGRILAGVNVQDRYRAKIKRSDRFTDPSMEEKVSWEDQTEVKDGRDYSANISYTAEVGDTGRFSIDGFYVKTDRETSEVSFEEENDDGETINAHVPGLGDVDQKNWGIGAEYKFDMAGGTTEFDLDYARFEDASADFEAEHKYVGGVWDETWSTGGAEWDESEAEAEAVAAKDSETSFKFAHQRPAGTAELEFGVDYRSKKRDVAYTFGEWEAEEEPADPDAVPRELNDYALSRVGSAIEEQRLDPYIMLSGRGDMLSWEAGLRYETTESEVTSTEDGEPIGEGTVSKDYDVLLPSAHLRWDVTEADRISLSLARSIKRPNFNELMPALLNGEFGDNDYIGNPRLDSETANGIDLGYEHRLGRQGVVGINVFYRDVEDLIELVNTGEPSEEMLDTWEDMVDDGEAATIEEAMALEPADSWVFTSANVGDGKVWGVEFDLSTPLSAFGMDDTGVFLNYSWVDSEIEDFMGERRFNNQARSVFNIGFIQDLPSLAASFGVSYRKQGDAYERILGEEATVGYGEDLEAFVEKRFGESVALRLSAANLLDASKDEFFHKFDTLDDQLDRDYDEYELETEEAGPSYQLILRYAF